MRPGRARLVILLLALWLAGRTRHIDAIALAPASAAAVRAAPRITAVYYQEYLDRGVVAESAPAARVTVQSHLELSRLWRLWKVS